ncbi:carboxymuconolactone decarboxylase family protein [Streptomyces armeniacus]|uniref:Carboxymuconolactone decarboxylase family protein n=1 Tax=Streptomyces armeniacus TaxID=83291 RepID=A0A345XN20_9ACTN|nr:carboxymuconolactone decarboxylase family protein [Streptomyces armeniacus]AXK33036.1 carboxymuconolactone decarboxylase family protein [Streptomyces armeniacus]
MARISLDPPRTLTVRLAAWYSRRKFGKVLDPLAAMGHHPRMLRDSGRYEQRIARWNELDPGLKTLAVLAVSARIGCSWCVDFGHWEADEQGLPMEKIQYVPSWREHREEFGELELLVLELADAMTETVPSVTDELAAALVDRLGERPFMELVMMVAVENQRSRVNAALGLTGQGFSDQCAVPLRTA